MQFYVLLVEALLFASLAASFFARERAHVTKCFDHCSSVQGELSLSPIA